MNANFLAQTISETNRAGADQGFWNGGTQVERRRREFRGRRQEGRGLGKGVPLSNEGGERKGGEGEGAVPPPQKFF